MAKQPSNAHIPAPQAVIINHKRWLLRFCDLGQILGECDSPSTPRKEIRIHQKLLRGDPDKLAVVLYHEFFHAADWHKDHDWIDPVSRDLVRFMSINGFSRT